MFQQAVSNARDKAVSAAGLLDVRLGPAIEVEETTNHDHNITGTSPLPGRSEEECDTNDKEGSSQRVRETYSAVVRVKFEVTPLMRICHHTSCPKHY